MSKNVGFCPLEHVNKNGAYPNLGTIACFGAAGATAGSGITLIACEQLSKIEPIHRQALIGLETTIRSI